MVSKLLNGLFIVIIVLTCNVIKAADNDKQALIPASIGNLNILGSTTIKENLKRAVYFPEYKGLLMIGFMHYMYNANRQSPSVLLDLTTVLFYTLLETPDSLEPAEYKQIYNILADQSINTEQMISQLYDLLSDIPLKDNIPGISINLRSAILQISEVAKGNFDAISPFIINIMIQDVDWSKFNEVFNDSYTMIHYYQKSLQTINNGNNIFLNCVKNKNRRRNRNDFSLYNGNVRWLEGTKIINDRKMAGAIELSGLNHGAEDGNLGSLWDKVCNAPITQDFLR